MRAPEEVTTFAEAAELVRWCELAVPGVVVVVVPSAGSLVVVDLGGGDAVEYVEAMADPADKLRELVPMGWALALTPGGDLMGVPL